MQKFFRNFIKILYRNKCCYCGTTDCDDGSMLCKNCWGDLNSCLIDSYCSRCGKQSSAYLNPSEGCSDCADKQFHFDAISTAGIYTGSLKNMLCGFKLSDRTEFAPLLGFLADAAIRRAEFFKDIDVIVPVPLHWKRRLTRGFNQSAVIARKMKLKNVEYSTSLLRVRNTKQQAQLSAQQRQKNIENAFAVRPDSGFAGKRICIVDDIKTTGSTLSECAKTLKQAGADKVYAFVLAVAGQDG